MNVWTIVPMRGLASGKSRLAAILSPEQRRALNAGLLQRTLDAVVAVDGSAARCIVASADAEVLELARRRGANVLLEASDAGLNAALELAQQTAVARGADTLMIVAADLPNVDGAALARLRSATPCAAAAVIADKSGTGTNGLLMPARIALTFAFGHESLERHRAALAALGVAVRVWRDPALAFDIDTPEDYRAWTAGEPDGAKIGAA